MTNTATPRRDKQIARHTSNLGSPDRVVARRAETYLMRHYGAEAMEPLVVACASDNSAVRYRAVWVLGHTFDSRAFDTVLRLTRDPDPAVRYDAAIALGVLGDDRAVGPLVALLQEPDEEHAVDSAAAMGLERLCGAAVHALLDVVREGSGYARVMAIHALGGIGDGMAVELLTSLLDDADEQTRAAAGEALEEIAAGGADFDVPTRDRGAQ